MKELYSTSHVTSHVTGLAMSLTLGLALSTGCSKNVSDVGDTPAQAVKSQKLPSPGQFTKGKRRGMGGMGGMGAMNRPTPKLEWTLPAGWKSVPPKSRMRRAEIVLPKAKGADEAHLLVFHFPGQGGAPMANVQRWVGQFKSTGDKKIEPKVEKRKVGDLPLTIVSYRGTYMQSMGGSMTKRGPVKERTGYALIAAIVETPKGPWFFKATGPEATIEHNRKAFEAF
ncbi:MAG: hypothetical protein JRH20_32700, partial [Deltaproteobacteria bacterium]|nr:hypothetical protein [Deltaproteobacteria bacterium]